MKYAQTTTEIILIALFSIIVSVIIAKQLGLDDFARATIFGASSRNGGVVNVPSMMR